MLEVMLDRVMEFFANPVVMLVLFILLFGRQSKKAQSPQPAPEEETSETENETEAMEEEELPEGTEPQSLTEEDEDSSEPVSSAGRLGFEIPELKKSRREDLVDEVYVEVQEEDGSSCGGYVHEVQAEAGFEDEWEMEKRPRGQEPQRAEEYQRTAEERNQAVHKEHHHSKLEREETAAAVPQSRAPFILEGRDALANALLSAEIFGPPKAYRRKH